MKALVASTMVLALLAGSLGLMHLTEVTLNAAEAAAVLQDMPQPTAAERETLQNLHRQLQTFKGQLRTAGKYSCCISGGCDFCALAGAMCPCGMKLSAGEAVCGECKHGWQSGQGQLSNINASQVQALPDEMARMMMQMRAMHKGGQ